MANTESGNVGTGIIPPDPAPEMTISGCRTQSVNVIDHRGRNTMAVLPHKDRLVIYIDDVESSSAS